MAEDKMASTCIRLPDALLKKFKHTLVDENLSMSEAMRMLIGIYVEEKEAEHHEAKK